MKIESFKKFPSMRKSMSILLILTMVTSLFAGSAYANDTPVSHLENNGSVLWPYTGSIGKDKIAAAQSIGYFGSSWLPGVNQWSFVFRLAGTGSSRTSTDTTSNRIQIARMEIRNTENPSKMSLNDYSHTAAIGSAPETTGTNPGYTTWAWAVVNYASLHLKLISSYVYTTATLLASFRPVVDSNTTTASSMTRQWNWTSNISDTGQFFWFNANVPANVASTKFSTEYFLLGTGYELVSSGKCIYTLTTGAAGSASKNAATLDKDWNPGMMTPEEKTKYGIIEIPRDEIDERASELNIAPFVVESLKESNEEVFYHATKFPVTVSYIPEPKNLSLKESLIQDIEGKLERSEIISDAYLRYDEKTAEEQKMIEKHENQINILRDILESANQADDKNLIKLNEIRSSLSNLK